jgi:hypothetical protein
MSWWQHWLMLIGAGKVGEVLYHCWKIWRRRV